MERNALKEILQNVYSRPKWIATLQFLTGQNKGLNIFLEPKEISLSTEKEKEIVRHLFQLGTLKTADDVVLPIFEIELQENIKIEYNRVGVNELIKAHILKDANIGALATYFYQDKNPKEWRFSFISKHVGSDFFNEAETKETNPKKFTYIFGTPEQHRTAIERIFNLKQSSLYLDDFFEAFNVEPVSKNFFKEYKNFYLDFVHDISTSEMRSVFVKDSNIKDVDLEIRNFVKRFLGRLVFLYFLQKKRWLGASNKNYEDGDSNFLEKLFNGEFGKIDQEKFYEQWMSKLFFSALNKADRENDGFELPNKQKVCVPFLNGGLFEEFHEPTEHYQIRFQVYRLEELFSFFNGYNFTIYENSPDEHTMAVDPEMLGHIFENLLEDNKDKGAFYTPKEIVHYMTQESLIEYLYAKTQRERATLEMLVKNHNGNDFSRAELKEIESYIDQVKICDPAIGSGAFPMGLLQEIFALKAFIHFTLGYEVWSPAKIKQDIIQNSIYGVDIEEGAVDIARLRFWLSLVVDEPKPKPLPNLDFKIVVGNSLVSRYDLDSPIDNVFNEFNKKVLNGEIDNPKIQEIISNQPLDLVGYKKLVNDFLNESNPDKKALFKELIQEIKLSFKSTLEETEKDKIAKARGKLFNLQQTDMFGKLKGTKTDITKAKKKLSRLEEKRTTILNNEFYTNAVEWRFEFPHLLNEIGEFIGFDIVIGNPPYIQIQKMDESTFNPTYEKFKTFSKSGDIYCLFYEQAANLLQKHGVISYITSNSWLKTKYGKLLRNFLATSLNPLYLLNFEDTLIFPSATVEANIFIGKKGIWENELSVASIGKDYTSQISLTNFFNEKKVTLFDLDEEGWIILGAKELEIQNLMRINTELLVDWEIKIRIGILNGFNDAFIIDAKTKAKLINEDPNSINIIKPLLRGKDLKRYSYQWADLWLIHSHNGLKKKGISRIDVQKDYPAVFRHLLPFEKELEERKNKGDHWSNLRNCAYFEEFDEPKVLWGELSDLPKFVYENQGMYAEATLFAMIGKNLKYLTAILNSKAALWFFSLITTTSGMGTSRWKKYKIEQLPIPKIKHEKLFSFFVDLVQNGYKTGVEDEVNLLVFFEEVIDGCVFELYFPEHMKEKGLNILDLVLEAINKTFGAEIDLEKIGPTKEKDKIWQLYNTLKEGEVQKRMRDFVSKSPEILKPIIQYK